MSTAKDTGIVATCGGDTVCLIDCGTGQVMKRFKQQKEVCHYLFYTASSKKLTPRHCAIKMSNLNKSE